MTEPTAERHFNKEQMEMDNSTKYSQVFMATFGLSAEQLPGLKYQDVAAWDSVGHMSLAAALEEAFGISLEADDIIDFSSFEKGKEILAKYDIVL